MIFIHLLGQPLIVRSHSEVHRSRGNPKEIPTWASRVSNYSYFPWFNRQQTWRHLLSVEKLQIFQHLVFIKILLHVFNHLVSVTKLHVIGHLVSVTKLHVLNHLESVTKLHVFNYLASVEKPQILYYLVSGAKIFDINPRVTLPFSGRQTVGSHSNKGDNSICIIKFANDMQQVGGFLCALRCPPPIKVTATI